MAAHVPQPPLGIHDHLPDAHILRWEREDPKPARYRVQTDDGISRDLVGPHPAGSAYSLITFPAVGFTQMSFPLPARVEERRGRAEPADCDCRESFRKRGQNRGNICTFDGKRREIERRVWRELGG